ncbi:TIGR03943 family putative permease subunit [Streptomyces sp. NPDC012637]|uniref:TIGR03943 family putative permease subunit n=1 Tax=Streptomyces sp. NPDC012637 TaxID=3364842 RepID=UPI0036E611F8
MKERARQAGRFGLPLLLTAIGGGLLHITVGSDTYLRYVKEGLWAPLILSGVLLVILGGTGLAAEVRERLRQPVVQLRRDAHGRPYWHDTSHDHADHEDHGHGHGHGHGGAPRVAWLLAVPALTLLFFAPPALGSYTASREGARAAAERTSFADLKDVPTVPMSMREFIGRTAYEQMSLRGRKIRLVGFASPGPRPDTWYLNRLTVSCCAADARPLRVEMHGAAAPPTDTWVEVTGLWRSGEVDPENPLPAFDVGESRTVPEPRNPYQDTPPEAAGA